MAWLREGGPRGGDRSYVEVNRAALERLRAFVDTASDGELRASYGGRMMVASVLAHVAFWDLRVVACVEAWGPDGAGPVPTYHDDAVDWTNDAAKPLDSALEPRTAARVTVEAAESADRAVAGLSDELSARDEALGRPDDFSSARTTGFSTSTKTERLLSRD